jgi:hypothetical protein
MNINQSPILDTALIGDFLINNLLQVDAPGIETTPTGINPEGAITGYYVHNGDVYRVCPNWAIPGDPAWACISSPERYTRIQFCLSGGPHV